MIGAIARVVRGLVGLATLLLLVAGVPWFLYRAVGNPWPGRDAIEFRDERQILLGVLATAAWVVWARFVVAVLYEFAVQLAHLRRERAAGVSTVGASAPPPAPTGGIGKLAARLVALVLTLLPAAAPTVASATAPLPFRPAPAMATVVVDAGTGGGGAPATAVPATESALPVIEVQGNDSLFRIAERHLGERGRWREILELNADRIQTDGARLTTPSALRSGWTLVLPADALMVAGEPAHLPRGAPSERLAVAEETTPLTVPAVEEMPPAIDPSATTYVVEPGDSYWRIADRHLEITLGHPPSDAQVLDVTLDLLATNAPLFGYDDPAMLHPGDEVIVPAAWPAPAVTPEALPVPLPPPTADATPAPVDESSAADAPAAETPDTETGVDAPSLAGEAPPATTDPVPAPASSTLPSGAPLPPPVPPGTALGPSRGEAVPVTGPPTTTTVDRELLGLDDPDERSMSIPLGVGGAVLLAGGVLTIIDARRRAALRRAEAHARLRQLEVRPTEVQLRALDGPERLLRLDLALRALAAVLREQRAQPLVCLVEPGGSVRVRLSAPATMPAPWVGLDDCWCTLPGSVDDDELVPLARSAGLPCPGIVHLGTSEGADVYLDLEAVGVLGVDGPAEAAAAIVDAAALGLAVSPFATGATLTMVGVDERIVDARPDVELGFDLATATATARAMVGTIAAATSMGSSTFDLRARSTAERWEPVLVVLGGGVAPSAELCDLAGPGGRGVALLSASPVDGAAAITCHDGRWHLRPWDLPLDPVGVGPDDIAAVVDLLHASDGELLEAPEALDAEPTDVVPRAYDDRDWEVLVRLLGKVQVHDGAGNPARFERSKAQELVCWLALHRENATRSAARTALWETDVRDSTFANVVSDARRNLARLVAPPDGAEWIGRTLTESLPLHELVATDAELLGDRVRAARGLPADPAIDILRPGLALVSDVPFAGTGYLWPDAEGSMTQLVLLVTTAAIEMATHCLEIGDIEGVFWASGQGLRVLPGHEELVALRMRAHAKAGDLAAVRAEWGSYERALAADPWSDAEPAAKLVELRRELLGAVPAETHA